MGGEYNGRYLWLKHANWDPETSRFNNSSGNLIWELTSTAVDDTMLSVPVEAHHRERRSDIQHRRIRRGDAVDVGR